MSTPFDPAPDMDRLDPSVALSLEFEAAVRVPVVLALNAYDAFQITSGLLTLESFSAIRGDTNMADQLQRLERHIAEHARFSPKMKEVLAGNRRALGLAALD